MAKTPQLVPESQFPEEGLKGTKQKQPSPQEILPTVGWLTLSIATAADGIVPWGRNQALRDRQLREFWPTESYLAGAVSTVSERNGAYEWRIEHKSTKIEEAVTEMLNAAMAGDSFGWMPFMEKFSQDLLCQDNGAFIEIIRDPVGRFQKEDAPVVAIGHLDAGRCIRTGNMKYPVIYTDKEGKRHKMPWYNIIPFSDFPSSIESMNGVGFSSVTRALRLSQIMRSILLYKDEKVSGRHIKSLHVIGGVSRHELDDVMKREIERADSDGRARYMGPALLASLDPEKPVSTATVDLASLPDGFNFDEEMKWYISGLALTFGVDYQDLAPLPTGGLGSGAQGDMLHKKSSITGRAAFMRKITEGLKNYGVLPRNATMIFTDKNEQEEREKQEVRTLAQEEYALAIRNGMMSPSTARKDAVKRGIYEKWMLEESLPQIITGENPVGQRGGNTIREDAGRQTTGKPRERVGDRLRKENMSEGLKDYFMAVLEDRRIQKDDRALDNLIDALKNFKVVVPPAEVTVNIPEQKEDKNLEKLVKAVQNTPAPNITVNVPRQKPPTVNVKMPRVKKQKQTVKRNSSKDIVSTETQYEYEE